MRLWTRIPINIIFLHSFIIRVSLFGVNSIDELKSDVKKEWIAAWGAEKGVSQENSQRLNKVGDITKKYFQQWEIFYPTR